MKKNTETFPEVWSARIGTPFAVLGIRSNGSHITNIAFLSRQRKEAAPADALSERAAHEILRYLDDPHASFSVPIMPQGTVFQQRVWRALQEIPSGSVLTYGALATQLKTAPRAVGGACGANPIVLMIPCHRVAGQHSLGGFMNAEEGEPLCIKRWLLTHEGVTADELER
jgi:O-6-methylguanine DNA methyltransferase